MIKDMLPLEGLLREKLGRRPAGIDKLDSLWDAAVLLPLVTSPDGPAVLFEVRAQTLKRQPGEICFPGGKAECGDKGFANTAVRETCEELGITPADITLVGELDALVSHSGPIIHPFVGFIADTAKIVRGKSEVDEVFTVPLAALLAQEPLRCSMQLADHPGDDFPFELVPYRQRSWRRSKNYYVYFYQYQGRVIWGMTARILYGFLYRSRGLLEKFLEMS